MTKNEKWINDYIKDVDLGHIEWIKLNSLGLEEFFQENYYDKNECEYVNDELNTFQRDVPLGLHYISYNLVNNKCSFLLGTVNNSIGKKLSLLPLNF